MEEKAASNSPPSQLGITIVEDDDEQRSTSKGPVQKHRISTTTRFSVDDLLAAATSAAMSARPSAMAALALGK